MNGISLAVAFLLLTTGGVDGGGLTMPVCCDTYEKKVVSGTITLELLPEWQDSILKVTVEAESRSTDVGLVNLGEQIRLVVQGQVFEPRVIGRLRGRRAVAWMIFTLPKRPDQFAISIRDVPEGEFRILRWSSVAITP